jgi:hypothetical protein
MVQLVSSKIDNCLFINTYLQYKLRILFTRARDFLALWNPKFDHHVDKHAAEKHSDPVECYFLYLFLFVH